MTRFPDIAAAPWSQSPTQGTTDLNEIACVVLAALRRQPRDLVYAQSRFRDWAYPASSETLDEAAAAAGRALARFSPCWLEGLTGHGASLVQSEILVMTALAASQRRMDKVHAQALALLAADGYAPLLASPIDDFANMLASHGQWVPATPSGMSGSIDFAAMAQETVHHTKPRWEIDTLSHGERLVIEGVRYVVACWRQQKASHPQLDKAMRGHGLVDCAGSLDALLAIMAASASRSIDIRCRCCGSYSADEARLIQAIAALQRDAADMAMRLMQQMIAPSACRLAIEPLRGLARGMVRGQVILPRRPLPPDLPRRESDARVPIATGASPSLH